MDGNFYMAFIVDVCTVPLEDVRVIRQWYSATVLRIRLHNSPTAPYLRCVSYQVSNSQTLCHKGHWVMEEAQLDSRCFASFSKGTNSLVLLI